MVFQKSSEYAVHLMLALALFGFIFLSLEQKRLMFICLIASAFMAFYLKMASNPDMMFPQKTSSATLKVAHFNLTSFDKENIDLEALISEINPDLLSFQEYTPDWDQHIPMLLYKMYPYAYKLVRIDPFGMAVYSKIPLKNTKTFNYSDIPNISIALGREYNDVHIIGSYITPPNLANSKNSSEEHLGFIANYINDLNKPVITLGDFNHVYWSRAIIEFRDKAGLSNSRRNISLTSLQIPYDHIFYSDGLECIKFEEIKDGRQNHLGISGTYQISPRRAYSHYSQTSMVPPLYLDKSIK